MQGLNLTSYGPPKQTTPAGPPQIAPGNFAPPTSKLIPNSNGAHPPNSNSQSQSNNNGGAGFNIENQHGKIPERFSMVNQQPPSVPNQNGLPQNQFANNGPSPVPPQNGPHTGFSNAGPAQQPQTGFPNAGPLQQQTGPPPQQSQPQLRNNQGVSWKIPV